MVLGAVLGGLAGGFGSGLGSSAGNFIGGLFGGNRGSSSSSPWGNIDVQQFYDNYVSMMNPVFDRVYSGLNDYREQTNQQTNSLINNNFSNSQTRSEFKDSLSGGGFKDWTRLARQGYMGWDDVRDQIASQASRAGISATDKVYGGNTLAGVLNHLDRQSAKDAPVNFARGITGVAQSLLGRQLTDKELDFYTPNKGFSTLSSVADYMSKTDEAKARNPGSLFSSLGQLYGHGTRLYSFQDENKPKFPESNKTKKENKNNSSEFVA